MSDPRVEQIFAATHGLRPEQRRAEVVRLCGGDAALEAECLRLLGLAETAAAQGPRADKASAKAGFPQVAVPTQPLDPNAAGPITPGRHGPVKTPESIGPYRILSVLGEGGFGVVYAAERRQPIKQRVALKVIKPGMDSRAVIARFEQERQALAVMNHPNIAKVFDAGVTDESIGSRPYFVMEHVAGEPITDYADRHNLTLRERLELFIPVCQAVQHAHHKGIIHRDIKPSNIIVAVHDGTPVPKVIDFGVAKATAKVFTEATIFTEQGQLIGTPEYMSPEQAEMGGTDIDTRTDVYSLGAVLYELLTGAVPFDSRSLRAAALVEIQRIIREVEPPKPSTRLTSLGGEEATVIASHRQMDREGLAGELRRELDWIPLKALRKDRTERYATPKDLAEDVQNYLDGKPLDAGPESTAYRVHKFIRRNRGAVMAGSLVAAALIVGVVGLGLGAWWAAQEAENARAAEVEQRRLAEANLDLAEAEAQQRARADERAAAAEQAEAQAIAARDAERRRAGELTQVSDFQSQMLGQIDTTEAGFELMDDIRRRFVAALEAAGIPEEDRNARLNALRQELVRVNATDTAAALIDRTILRPALTTIDEQFHDQPVVDAQLRQALANIYRTIGFYDAALPLQESALATRRRVVGEEHPDTLTSLNNMGLLLQAKGSLAEAEPYYREALESRRRVQGEEHPDTLISINNMGYLLQAQNKLDEAEPYFREALEKLRLVQGDEHLNTLTSIGNMGFLLQAQGKPTEAEPYFREALEKSRRVLGQEHPYTLTSIGNMGTFLKALGNLDEAEPYYREALEKSRRVLGDEHPETLISISNMGFLLWAQGKLAEAGPYFQEAMEKSRRVLGGEHPKTITCISTMGALLRAQEKLVEAEPYYREALEVSRRVLEAGHPDLLFAIGDMGALLREQGRLGEAEPYFREAVEVSRRVLGGEHPTSLSILSSTGALLREQGKCQEAWDLLDPVEPAARRVFTGGNARRLASFLTTLARACVGLGYDSERFARAEANFLEAYPIFVESRGETHPDTLGCVQGLIDLYTAWDQAEPGKGYADAEATWRVRLRE